MMTATDARTAAALRRLLLRLTSMESAAVVAITTLIMLLPSSNPLEARGLESWFGDQRGSRVLQRV